jgi:hypothetical protein
MNLRALFLCAAILIASPLVARERTDVLVLQNGDRITKPWTMDEFCGLKILRIFRTESGRLGQRKVNGERKVI